MNLQHITFKIFVDGKLTADWEQFINIFHGWVATQSMPEMMIDVADYRHVPNGPGVVMVGRDADYYMDNTAGKPGLRYVCKAKHDADNEAQIQQAFTNAASACVRLESELAGLKFSRTDFELTVNDRAVAPNNDATQAALEKELPTILEKVLGASATIEIQKDARKLSGCQIKASSPVALTAAT